MARTELNTRGNRNNIRNFKQTAARNSKDIRKTSDSRQRQTDIRDNISERTNKIMIGSYDFIILLSIILLVLFGIIMVFSASYYTTGNNAKYDYDMYYFLKRHVLWTILGFIAMMLINNFNYTYLKKFTPYIFIIANVLLVLVLFMGKKVNGARRWLQIGPIGFQPSEVAKIALILFLASVISNNKKLLNTWSGFFLCTGIVLIPAGLTGIENGSTAIVITIIGMGIIFVASPKIRYFVVAGVGGVAGLVFMFLGEGFRMERFEAWKDPFKYSQGVGYQTVQSLYAIASGGLFGLGLGQSRQKLGYIPEGHNDIIFAIIAEELGLFGAAILIMLFGIFIWRGIKVSMNAVDMFGCLIATGITTMISVQVIINIAVVTNTIPNTGIPLPFISYGGTSLLLTMSAIGIILNISRYYKE